MSIESFEQEKTPKRRETEVGNIPAAEKAADNKVLSEETLEHIDITTANALTEGKEATGGSFDLDPEIIQGIKSELGLEGKLDDLDKEIRKASRQARFKILTLLKGLVAGASLLGTLGTHESNAQGISRDVPQDKVREYWSPPKSQQREIYGDRTKFEEMTLDGLRLDI